MKKKNGFTLVEMIGAIIILGIISIIAYATYTSSLRGFRDDYYVEVVRTLEESGKEFFNDNRNYRPQAVLGGQKVSISRLVEEGFIDEIKDYNGKACNNSSYVIVIKEGKDDYSYHVCLVCSEDSYDNTKDNYCNPAWEDSSTVEYGLGTIEPLYVYKGTPRGELREKLKIAISYVKKDYNGNVLGEASGTGFDDVPTIYPTNMDEIDTDKVGEYVLNYEYNGATAEGKVVVYENNEPNFNIKYKSEVATNLNGTKQLNSGNYNSGEWQQRIFVKVSQNGTIVEPGVTISRYQWNKDGKWQDFCIMQPSGACAPQGEYLQTATDSDMAGYIEIVNDMNETIEFRTVASNGKISRVTTPVIIRRDNTDPTCELKKTGAMGDNSWYTSNVAVEFNKNNDVQNKAGDNKAISGIKTNNITLSTGALNRLSSNTLYNHTQDISDIEYKGYVEDQAGNFYICKINFKKDGTNPTCGNNGDSISWQKTSRTINYTCGDNLSGCRTGFSGGSKTYSTTKKTDVIPAYTIKDNAGNTVTCPARTANIYVDTSKPLCNGKSYSGSTTSGVTAIVNCNDLDSGCTSAQFTAYTSSSGSITIKDNVGNTESCPYTVYTQRQSRTKSCTGGNRCSAAGCERHNSCQNASACGSDRKCSSEEHSGNYKSGCPSGEETISCTGNMSGSGVYCRCRKTTCTNIAKSCENDSCSCNTYNSNIEKCGCSSWSGFGSWSDNSSCSAGESSNHQTTTECQTVYRVS